MKASIVAKVVFEDIVYFYDTTDLNAGNGSIHFGLEKNEEDGTYLATVSIKDADGNDIAFCGLKPEDLLNSVSLCQPNKIRDILL